MRQSRIGLAHRLDQRIDHFGLDAVRQMPRGGNVLEAAPAVGDFLVLGERVGDQRELAKIFLERIGERLRGGLALLLVAVLHEVERLLDAQLLAADLEAQRRDGLVEQPVPGRIGRHRLLVEKLLDAILELIGLFLPHLLDPGPVMAERRLRHRPVEHGIVDAVQFQREEQKMQRRRGDALLHVAVELGAGRIDRVAGIDQRRIRNDAAEQILDRLITLERLGQCGRIVPGKLFEPAFVVCLELGALGIALLEVELHLRAVDRLVQVRQIPFRQRAELRRLGLRFFGGGAGARHGRKSS